MELEVKLICARTELIMGEDTPLFVSVTNTGSKDLTIPDIQRSPDWPKLRVRDVTRDSERTYGPHDLERKQIHEFLPPPRPVSAKLEPGASARRNDRLLRWVEFDQAGTYEITASFPSAQGLVESPTITLDILPLKLHSAIMSGPDGGANPLHTTIWVHEATDGAVIVVSMVNLDADNAKVIFSERVVEVPEFVAPIPSIAALRRLYPAHWLAWISPRGLEGRYFLQQSPGIAAIPRPIQQGQLLSPGLLDSTGATLDRPARAQVAVWHASPDEPRLEFFTFESDGSITPSSAIKVAPGELLWASAVIMADGEGRWVLLMRRANGTEVDMYGHLRAGSVSVAPYSFSLSRGVAIGARILLTRDESLIAAVVVADAVGTVVIPWEMPRRGPAAIGSEIVLDADGARIVRAHVAIAEGGALLILAQTADGRWLYAQRDGVLKALPPHIKRLGLPIGAEFSPTGIPFVVMAAAETGIRFVSLSIAKHAHGH